MLKAFENLFPTTRSPQFFIDDRACQALVSRRQLQELARRMVACGARIQLLSEICARHPKPVAALNAVIVGEGLEERAFLGRWRCPRRQAEQKTHAELLRSLGISVFSHSLYPLCLQDVAVMPGARRAFLGYGIRSDRESRKELEEFFHAPIETLHLVDPTLPQLSAALFTLEEGVVLACREAFDSESWRKLRQCSEVTELVAISRDTARAFSMGFWEIGNTVIMGAADRNGVALLDRLGRDCEIIPIREALSDAGPLGLGVLRVHEGVLSADSKNFSSGARELHQIEAIR